VPGAFTLAGWREVIKGRIQASDQQLADDWLLREAFGERQTSIQAMLLKLYVDDYIAAWAAYFRGVDVARAGGLQGAAQQLARLGDKDSPFRLLLEAAAEQLRLRDDQLGEAGGLDRVEKAWSSLHALFAKTKDGEDEGKPVDGFLADFKKLTGELEHLRDAENPSAAAATFTRGIMQGGQDDSAVSGAMSRARRHVNRVDGLAACNDALGEFLKRPAQGAWRACLVESARHLDAAWKQRVFDPFSQMLDRRYPFYPSGPDASLDDFSNFFGPRGILATFAGEELAAYRSATGEPVLRHGLGLELNAEANAALERAQRYREIFFRDGGDKPALRFELVPGRPQLLSGRDPVVEATRLTLDNNRLLYEMGHPQPREFTWPGEGERREASLALRCSKAGPEPLSADGSPWGLFKLLDKARLESIDGRRMKVTWTLEKSGDSRVAVPYELRAASAVHPFVSGFFEFRCPARLSP
jgi:type VI secretion system protein ImpL